jgi:hypothetical protein
VGHENPEEIPHKDDQFVAVEHLEFPAIHLPVALNLGIPCGGWCPNGRRAEDGPIDSCYPLIEIASADYRVRTRKNVEDSDGTLILTIGPVTGGSAFTLKVAKEMGNPHFVVDLVKKPDAVSVRRWAETNSVRTLNVAGPRASKCPDTCALAGAFLREILAGSERQALCENMT